MAAFQSLCQTSAKCYFCAVHCLLLVLFKVMYLPKSKPPIKGQISLTSLTNG